MQYKFSKDLYTKNAVFKSAYKFTDQYYIHLDVVENYYIVTIEQKEDSEEENFEKEFQNELIEQMNREIIADKTKNIREIIMARALSSTFIYQDEDEGELQNQASSSQKEVNKKTNVERNDDNVINDNDVMKDWFDVYGK